MDPEWKWNKSWGEYLYSANVTKAGLHWKFVCRFNPMSSQNMRSTYLKIKCCFYVFSIQRGRHGGGRKNKNARRAQTDGDEFDIHSQGH